MMTARLLELHRVLKSTGAIYLHCDPTASHYLKVILDAIFGAANFRSEVIWKRTHAHSGGNRFGPVHDVIIFYAKSPTHACKPERVPYSPEYIEGFFKGTDPDGRRFRSTILTGSGTRNGDSGKPWRGVDPNAAGRHWAVPGYLRPMLGEPAPATVQEALDRLDQMGRVLWPKKKGGTPSLKQYLDDMEGVEVQDVWTDIPPISAHAKERLGYPTQKPLALLERIILSSSKEGDLVLDPFCGCGTAVDAAQKLHRKWTGIDITYLAVDLIRKRLRHSYGDEIESTYEVHGIPTDVPGAEALFSENPFDFERWAVSLVNGQPNEKQVGDKGVDGRIRFHADKEQIGTILVSVKGGKQVNPAMVQSLAGAVTQHKAELGLFIMLSSPTKGMKEVVLQSGTYTVPMTGASFPRVQIATISDLLAGHPPPLPAAILPYIQAKAKPGSEAVPMF